MASSLVEVEEKEDEGSKSLSLAHYFDLILSFLSGHLTIFYSTTYIVLNFYPKEYKP